ncbi:hypothetical protein H5410_017540 [Solanum commersonii]|uniref:Protein kinase domain-containing protein n=1 Tax=Solanum commersonii TaxID=4109 RepID=A0A9J6A0N0_SOLCO|nr:hypothetical protein H5410_017540 [Solanum commersonii]
MSQITEDPSRVFASWNQSVHLCQWTGVKCGLTQERVISLNLKGRSLAGEIPVNLSHCVNLKNLVLDHNTLVGQIPYQVGSLTKLVRLYLRNNNLTGIFPVSIGNLTSLEELYLSHNSLEGEVPASLARLTKLRLLGLSVNSFSGEFPPSLLYLGICQFHGSIPSSLANASKLLQLDFPVNKFTGNIPKGFDNLRNLLWLNVGSNHLGYGKNDDLDFVNSLTNCSSLQMLHFGDNQFVGTLPHSTVNLSSQLQRLLFFGNRIGGGIPREISNLVNLNLLDMSNNNLTGSIPDSIGRLANLGSLDLRNNLLTGKTQKHVLSLKLILTIVFAASFSILALLIVFLCWRRNLKDQPEPEVRSESARFYPNISYEELRIATGGFSSENFIGSGSSGTVYKGTFASNGMVVAVKVLNLLHQGASKSFIEECQALRNIRHRNLVRSSAHAQVLISREMSLKL